LPKGEAEQTQYDEFFELMQQVELTSTPDRWTWSLNPPSEFSVASQVSRLINRWWNISDVSDVEVVSFDSWKTWMGSIRLNSKSKMLFEGVYQV
nr:hypothetical protein [Tanacetum cinerariifolium]